MSVYNLRMSDDARLIRDHKLGDEQAFEELLEKYKLPLFNYILRVVRERAAAEDIFQDVWIRVIKSLPRYEEQNKFSSLLFKMANSKVVDYLRRSKHNFQYRDQVTSPPRGADIQRDIEKKELISLLNKRVIELSAKQKEVFLLRQHSNLTFKEITEMLGYPINTVLARMHNAILNLYKALKEAK